MGMQSGRRRRAEAPPHPQISTARALDMPPRSSPSHTYHSHLFRTQCALHARVKAVESGSTGARAPSERGNSWGGEMRYITYSLPLVATFSSPLLGCFPLLLVLFSFCSCAFSAGSSVALLYTTLEAFRVRVARPRKSLVARLG